MEISRDATPEERVLNICKTLGVEDASVISREVLLQNIHRLLSHDRVLVQKVVDEKFRALNSRSSMWDFADNLERTFSQSSSSVSVNRALAPPQPEQKKTIHEQLERFKRLDDAKEKKITAEVDRKTDLEVRECTFQPEINKNPLYDDMKPRYNFPRKHKSVSPSKRDPSPDAVFRASLRESMHSPVRPLVGEFVVGLTKTTLDRLDEATEFFEIYREQMAQLREYHSNLMNQYTARRDFPVNST